MTANEDERDRVPPGLLISVIVPVRNQSRQLKCLIEALWAQTIGPDRFEIIVVDNLSTDETPDVVRKMQAVSPVRMLHHVMPVNNGPAPSRNQGVRLASADLCAFTDSDCEPCPRWLELGISAFDTEIGFATGPVQFKPDERPNFLTRTTMLVPEEHSAYPTANIFYRKSVFLELGGFDENFRFPNFMNKREDEGVDTDLAWRIKKQGYHNVFLPEMIVYHEVQQQRPLDWLLTPFNIFVLPALVRRHPELRTAMLNWRLFVFKQNALFYLLLIGLCLAVTVSPWFALLALPFLLWAATWQNSRLSLLGVPRTMARTVLITIHRAVTCAGLIYGSVRFRCLVL